MVGSKASINTSHSVSSCIFSSESKCNLPHFQKEKCSTHWKSDLIWWCLCQLYFIIIFNFNSISHIRNHTISREYHPAMDHCLNLQGQTDQEWNKMLSLFSYSIIGCQLEEKSATVKSPGCYCFYKLYILWSLLRIRCSKNQIRSDQSLSCVWLFATPWIAARQASLSITNSRSSLRRTSIKSVMPSSHLILCNPLLLLSPIPPSIRVFSNESTLRMRWPKYWSFSVSIIPSKEIPGLISSTMDWLDLLAVQGTLKSLLQHHSLKASILQHSAFFTVQLSHPYMTTGNFLIKIILLFL